MAPLALAYRTGLAAACILLVPCLPAVQAHDPIEALELEVWAIEDEGTDVIDMYGGYDVLAVFLGGAHHPELGAGTAGDGFYFHIELYGQPEGATAALPHRVEVTFTAGNATHTRTITTPDGVAFASDFDALDLQTGDLVVHVNRAFLLWDSIGAAPGTPIGDLVVTSFYGDDPRDVAPGGIYVPGSGGAAMYPDPTQIDGRGRLVEDPVPPGVDVYFGAIGATGRGHDYRVAIASGLTQGEQHVIVPPVAAPGWNLTFHSAAGVVPANGTYILEFTAIPGAGAQALGFDVLTDVGGRLAIQVAPDGTLTLRGSETRPTVDDVAAPNLHVALAALAMAAVAARTARRTR